MGRSSTLIAQAVAHPTNTVQKIKSMKAKNEEWRKGNIPGGIFGLPLRGKSHKKTRSMEITRVKSETGPNP
jgi:hypothetical protein